MIIKIGVTSGWEDGTVINGWPLIYTVKGIIDALEEAGAIPIIIPILSNQELLKHYIDIVDAVIISGEVMSIKKNVFQEVKGNVLRNSNPLRYDNESALINKAIEEDKPLLGICRGFQVLNVEAGGDMKDNDITIGNNVIHQQGGLYLPTETSHSIKIRKDSKLYELIGIDELDVNSFHRQGVNKIPEGFKVSATAPDGTIEAIENRNKTFIMGLQFHPEMLSDNVWRCFFRNFVQLVRKSKNKK